MSKSKYPPKEGWITAKLTMVSNKIVKEEDIKGFLSGGQAADYEYAEITQHGRNVKAIYRRKPVAKAKEVAA